MDTPPRPTPERLDEISEDYVSLPVLGTDYTPEDWHRHCVISGRLIAAIPHLVAEIRRLRTLNATLDARDRTLAALEAAGVDNWEGYSQAFAEDPDEDGED